MYALLITTFAGLTVTPATCLNQARQPAAQFSLAYRAAQDQRGVEQAHQRMALQQAPRILLPH
jgi:Flp pilus assembly protein CpaB